MRKPTFYEILKDYPNAVYNLFFKNGDVLSYANADHVLEDIDKKYLGFCPEFKVDIFNEFPEFAVTAITAKF